MKLKIDSSQGSKCKIELIKNNKQIWSEEDESHFGSQVILLLILKGLQECDMTLQDLGEIEVKNSGLSFTGVRVGVAIANALGWSLKISVNRLPVGEFVKADLDQIHLDK